MWQNKTDRIKFYKKLVHFLMQNSFCSGLFTYVKKIDAISLPGNLRTLKITFKNEYAFIIKHVLKAIRMYKQ